MHKHGASCAIDSLMEFFYYGVYKSNVNRHLLEGSTIIDLLIHVCNLRAKENKSLDCCWREPLWDWLVSKHPRAFAPKGRGDAEFLVGLHELTSNSEIFKAVFSCQNMCISCNAQKDIVSNVNILSLTTKCNEITNGAIGQAVEKQFEAFCRSQVPICCNKKMKVNDGTLTVPEFVVLELNVKDSHNLQQPPVQIEESIYIWNTGYKLVSAVVVEPGHFFNVSRVGTSVVVLDGLKDTSVHFTNFASAFKQREVTDSLYVTSPYDRGIHVLLFKTCDETPLYVPTTCINFDRQVYTSSCKDAEVIDLENDSHCNAKDTAQNCKQSNACLPDDNEGFTQQRGSVKHPSKATFGKTSANSVKLENKFQHLADELDSVPPFTPTKRSKSEKHDFSKSNLIKRQEDKKRKKLSSGDVGNEMGRSQQLPRSPSTNNSKARKLESFHFEGHDVQYVAMNDSLFLSCSDFFSVLGITKQIQKEGYKYVDKKLQKSPWNVKTLFIFSGRVRKFIRIDAALFLAKRKQNDPGNTLESKLVSFLNEKAYWSDKHLEGSAKEQIDIESEVDQSSKCRESKCRKKISFVDSNATSEENSNIDIDRKFSIPTSQSENVSQANHTNKTTGTSNKKRKLRRKSTVLRKVMFDLYCNNYKREKVRLIKALAGLVKPKQHRFDRFNGTFSKEDIFCLLKFVKSSKKSKYKNLYEEIKGCAELNVEDIIHLEENFSGTRLINALRQKLPGILPSQNLEQQRKKDYNHEFDVILRPKRTSTGWKIDPDRLSEVLSFYYYWITGPKLWRVYGDGREIGGRQSCFISLSLVNNELALHNCSYQSPKAIFPVALFFEGDSRDNLEENLGYPNSWLDDFIKRASGMGDCFYLCGDEMFIESILDGRNELSPMSKQGWNIYSACRIEEKGFTDPVSKKRTDLIAKVDREIPTSILRSILLQNTVFCLLHGLARCVEKLLTLVVQDILLYSNIVNQRGEDGASYRDTKIRNLEININKRGVRQGRFTVPFDAGGKLQQIKLNKDHAWVILSPPPLGKDDEFPHVLTDVLPSDVNQDVNIPLNICKDLHLKDHYSEYEIVTEIWDHFYKMVAKLKKDPPPKHKGGHMSHSDNPEDYYWGYTPEDLTYYKHHAEAFYQLFSFKYTSVALTPYMVKFVDYGPFFMKELPFSLSRFQAEGGEHVNYEHSTYYYNHTTRHGGNFSLDPLLAIFRNMWKRLSYNISLLRSTPGGKAAAELFEVYKRQHKAASVIQRAYRKHRKYVEMGAATPTKSRGIFHGMVFVFSGSIPKINGNSFTHSSLKNMIENAGGRVSSSLPSRHKRSTKEYIVLTSKSNSSKKKLPACIHEAIRSKYKVLSYEFVVDSLQNDVVANATDYVIPFTGTLFRVRKYPSLENIHFSKRRGMLSHLKKTRKQRRKKSPVKRKIYNRKSFYIANQLRALCKEKSVSFEEAQHYMSEISKQYKSLSPRKQLQNEMAWRASLKSPKKSQRELSEMPFFKYICSSAYSKE